ncbi:hypothetical protein K7432_018043 [Basidiobolus ranarum]|uniref:Uncharacterized protein n=1 Tax=Basidiobolus ranarum TaxID=34480 RepID=A0ABR2VJK4_9FUNG
MSPKPCLTIDTKNSLLRGQTVKSNFSRDISNTTVHATLNLSRSKSLSNILRAFQEIPTPAASPITEFSIYDEKNVLIDCPKETVMSPTKAEELAELVLKVYQFLRPSNGPKEVSTIQMESYDELVFTAM